MAKKKAWYAKGGARRLAEIIGVLLKHGFLDLANRLNIPGLTKIAKVSAHFQQEGEWKALPTPQRVRMVMEELGPTFIKLGQVMSLHSDMFPEEYIEQFTKLRDNVPANSYEEIEEVITKELHKPISELFLDFEKEPIGSASVAQVHRAHLLNGQLVAVKVIRPGIRQLIQKDIRIMYRLAHSLAKRTEISEICHPTEVVEEFENIIFKELDMFSEASNIDRCADNFKEIPDVHLPKVHWDIISRSVLVSEFIVGFGTDDVEQMREHDINPKRVSQIGFECFAKQIMEDGFFHGDPHPGNALVMHDGRMAMVDFGIVGFLNDKMMRHIASVFLGYAERNYDRLIKTFIKMGLISEKDVDLDNFAEDLFEISEPLYGRDLNQISIEDVFERIMYMARKYHAKLPRNLLLLFKTMMQMEAIGRKLDPGANMLESARPYAKKLLSKGYDPRNMMYGFQEDMTSFFKSNLDMPIQIHKLVKKVIDGDTSISMKMAGLENMDKSVTRGINRLTLGIIVSASLMAAANVLNSSEILDYGIPALLGLPPDINFTHLLGLSGYLMATLIGGWLVFDILFLS